MTDEPIEELVALRRTADNAASLEERRDALKVLVQREDELGYGEVRMGYPDASNSSEVRRPTLDELERIEFDIKREELLRDR